MSNEIVLRSQAKAHTTLVRTADAMKARLQREEGQTSIEYVGIIVVVGIVGGALFTFAPGLGSKLTGAISSALGKLGI